MVEDKQFQIPDLILRAFSLARGSRNMAFIGIYSTETFEPLALADREHVQINSAMLTEEDQTRKMATEIFPKQIHAIVRHIRTPDNPLTQIYISNLRFVCLRTGSGCMTGLSNFNMDLETKRDSIPDINRSVFSIIHKRYTSQELLDGPHALQISAILKEDFIVVGMCKEGEESSLNILKAIFEEPNSQDSDVFEERFGEKESTENELFDNEGKSENFFTFERSENGNYAHEFFERPEVELRHSALSPEERKALQQKRETSFCEDWRTATSKSIDALKSIGPFRSPEDDFPYSDDRPLIDNIESIDTWPAENMSTTESRDNQALPKSKDARIVRRPSRATMV